MTGAILKITPEKSVELRYTARRAEKLENELGGSLIEGLAKCDRAGVAVKFIAHGADIPQSEAYDLFDEFIENGGSLNDLAEVIVTALENGGFIAKTALKTAKKIQNQLQNRAALRS